MTNSSISRWTMGLLVILTVGVGSGCFTVDAPFTGMAPGPWRGVLRLEANPVTPNPKGEPLPEKLALEFDEVTGGELPFTFEVKYLNDTQFYIELHNGEEVIRIDDITVGKDRKTAKDTVIINFPVYDSYIKGIFEENILQGFWVLNNRENYLIPFEARFGKDHRFTQLKKEPMMDISGAWEVTFEVGTEDEYQAVGEFTQEGNHLLGTFRTETGDYRFLEGTVQDNKVYLSTFDGAHAFLFEAKIRPDSTLIGSFRSGKHYRTIWEAKRNPDFELTDPNALTYLREGYDSFDFSFADTNGEAVSLQSEALQGKVKLIQITGTWCPNCRDETEFLVNYLNQNPAADLAVVALAFEKYRDRDKAQQILKDYRQEMGIEYPVLLAGYYDKTEAGEVLPMLNHVMSYPTLIFLDRQNRVRKIHTGFSGPATSRYEDFVREFETTINELLAETS